jgi:hypothetical protein
MRRLLRPLWIVVAVIFLVEGWLWRRLEAVLVRLVAAIGLPALKARLAGWIERLPPAATLLVFLVPGLLLLPLKLLGLWLLARGAWLWALGVLVLAKLVGVGVTAFIFHLTKPKLLRMPWFAWVYQRVQAALAWAHRQIDPITEAVRAWARVTVAPIMARLRRRLRGNGRLMRRLVRLRRRGHRA